MHNIMVEYFIATDELNLLKEPGEDYQARKALAIVRLGLFLAQTVIPAQEPEQGK